MTFYADSSAVKIYDAWTELKICNLNSRELLLEEENHERKMPSCLYLKYNRTQTLFSALCLFARLLYALLIALLISLFGLHLKKQKKWSGWQTTKTWWLKMRAKRVSYYITKIAFFDGFQLYLWGTCHYAWLMRIVSVIGKVLRI